MNTLHGSLLKVLLKLKVLDLYKLTAKWHAILMSNSNGVIPIYMSIFLLGHCHVFRIKRKDFFAGKIL